MMEAKAGSGRKIGHAIAPGEGSGGNEKQNTGRHDAGADDEAKVAGNGSLTISAADGDDDGGSHGEGEVVS